MKLKPTILQLDSAKSLQESKLFGKMKVKYETQVFSHTVLSALKIYCNFYPQVHSKNKLFDCYNSNNFYYRNPFKSELKQNSEIEIQMIEMRNYLKKCLPEFKKIYCIDDLFHTINLMMLAQDVWSQCDNQFLILS